MEPAPQLPRVFEKLRQRFEGRIKCRCGNTDWRKFLYVELVSSYIVGCKLCGHSLDYKDDTPSET